MHFPLNFKFVKLQLTHITNIATCFRQSTISPLTERLMILFDLPIIPVSKRRQFSSKCDVLRVWDVRWIMNQFQIIMIARISFP